MHPPAPGLSAPKIATGMMVIYGLPYMAYAVAALPLALFVPSYYADDMALPFAAVGIAIAASRILDVIIDPFIGIVSDSWNTRWGRRKPWIAAGAPLFMLSLWMIFAPPPGVTFEYLLGWTCLFFIAFTLVDLPYKAWGAELSTDYSERSRVTAWRESFGFAGQLVFVLVLMLLESFGQRESATQLRAIALTVILTLPPLLIVAFKTVPERPADTLAGEWPRGSAGLMLVARNPAFVRMMISVALFVSGLIIQATLHKIVLVHVTETPHLFATMLLLENIATIALVPLWIRISDRIGKHRALCLAALWAGLWSLLLPFHGQGEGWPLIGVLAIRGSSFASILFLANSIAADVVDHDTVTSGRQRTGLYFAIWGMTYKFTIALGVLLATVLPAYFGFEPADASTHTPSSEFALMAVYGWLPGVLMALGALILWNFPIDQTRQRALRALITQRALD